MHGLVSALKGTEFHRISFFASREFCGDMSATGCKLDISSSGSAPIVFHMLQEAKLPTSFLPFIIDPGAGTIGGTGYLVIDNRDFPVGWLSHIIVGGSIGGHGPDFFRIFQGKHIREHGAEAEAIDEDTCGINTQIVFDQSEYVVPEFRVIW